MLYGPKVEAGDKYEIQNIFKKRKKEGTSEYEYLVHWKGYDESHRTWEEAATLLVSAREVLNDFNNKNNPMNKVGDKRKRKSMEQ